MSPTDILESVPFAAGRTLFVGSCIATTAQQGRQSCALLDRQRWGGVNNSTDVTFKVRSRETATSIDEFGVIRAA